jgi:hypothetical protein
MTAAMNRTRGTMLLYVGSVVTLTGAIRIAVSPADPRASWALLAVGLVLALLGYLRASPS